MNTFGTGTIPEAEIEGLVREHFDLRPKGLIEMLDLKRPDLLQDCCLRPLRSQRRRIHLGKD